MLTRKQKRAIKNIIRRTYNGNDDYLAERLYIRECFDKYSEQGKIAVCRRGHDCDHYHYQTVRIIDTPKGVFAFCRAEDEHRRWLDGPEAMWLDPPSLYDNKDHWSGRDVAAEMAGY